MKKILVIEDMEMVRKQITMILCSDFTIREAKDGYAGLELAQAQIPDLILCDITMPGLDGYGVYEALRKNPRTAVIPFIFLTGRASREEMRRGMALGADDYLSKPFTASELLEAVQSRLRRTAAVQSNYAEQTQQAIEHVARHDALTGLPNIAPLREWLGEAIEANAEGELVGLLVVDIDHFRRISDTFGQGCAELLLQQAAKSLEEHLRISDTLFCLGDGRFCVLSPELPSVDELEALARTLLQASRQSFSYEPYELNLTASIGFAAYPEHAASAEQLLARSRAAAFHAVEQGRNTCQAFQPALELNMQERVQLEAALRLALERGQFSMHYQPQMHANGRILGCEALMRWNHPKMGSISPAKFIPIAEELGLIEELGNWTLQTACAQAVAWQRAGFAPIRMAANISGLHLQSGNLIPSVKAALQKSGLEARSLELELTESSIVRNTESTIRQLGELRALGLTIAIDDFGTGYSSLAYLKNFPLDVIKIDQSFVRDVATFSSNATIVQTIIALAHALGKQVIAEGVETAQELEWLREHGCTTLQGYYFSRPVPPAAFEKLLQTRS